MNRRCVPTRRHGRMKTTPLPLLLKHQHLQRAALVERVALGIAADHQARLARAVQWLQQRILRAAQQAEAARVGAIAYDLPPAAETAALYQHQAVALERHDPGS